MGGDAARAGRLEGKGDNKLDVEANRRIGEHLGMLGREGYRAGWEAKKLWYAEHGIVPWSEGGGERGILVWSQDDPATRGIDVPEIECLAQEVAR